MTIPDLNDFAKQVGISARAEERRHGRIEAEELYEHLQLRMKAFQASLDNDVEMGVQLANFGLPTEIHVRWIGYRNPNVIEFAGVLPDGKEVVLVQHVAQLSFLLVALPPLTDAEPYRVGFNK